MESDAGRNYKISANSLLKFMRKYEYLEDIIQKMAIFPRYNFEYLDYLNLYYEGIRIERIAYPMVCFCDIPLHQLAPHAEGENESGYGKYGIALSKSWGEQKGLQPILYVNENSELAKQFELSFNAALELSSVEEKGKDLSSKMEDGLFELFKYMKPNFGRMAENIDDKKNFHDEKEWRFIPKINERYAYNSYIDPIDQVNEYMLRIYSDALRMLPKIALSFNVSDVKYIFVENDKSRRKLIDFIDRKRTGRKIKRVEKLNLISKIIVYDEIKGDW